MQQENWVVIGAGAAGYFGAIELARQGHSVSLLEKNEKTLSKVKVSGGGRCNVTHNCLDPKDLIKHYPRGAKELLGAFYRFGPKETIRWFEEKGVNLKTEADGRMFPMSNSSQTIIDCLETEQARLHIQLLKGYNLTDIKTHPNGFTLHTQKGEVLEATHLLLTTGSSAKIWDILQTLGITIIPPVPSLFTFNIPSSSFLDISGVSLEHVKVQLETGHKQEGPLLFTHFGLSGPAILKLSAFAAKELFDKDYNCSLTIDFFPEISEENLGLALEKRKKTAGRDLIKNDNLFHLPKRLWEKIRTLSGITPNTLWAHLSNEQKKGLLTYLKKAFFQMEGKTTHKEEFVTAGGVALDEIDFTTMQSKKIPRIFFAGEILNIDGITGGFNFQSAWTTSFIAANHKR